MKIVLSFLLPRDEASSQKRPLTISMYLKEACNNNSFSFAELDTGWTIGSCLNMRCFWKNDHLLLRKFDYEKLSLLFVSQLSSVLGKTPHKTQ